MSENTGTQALWPQMIAALAAIDTALGLPEDGCNSTQRTLNEIERLITRNKVLLGELERVQKVSLEECGIGFVDLRVLTPNCGGERR